jgi:hypothetical protein
VCVHNWFISLDRFQGFDQVTQLAMVKKYQALSRLSSSHPSLSAQTSLAHIKWAKPTCASCEFYRIMLHFRLVRDAQSDKPTLPEQAQEVFYSVDVGV